ncbi:MAG: hypothetical protein NTX50_30350 [Candidatus Sumerlaeota bacterium]|nr:hypothetical protein [Candidatus Sumerlaeota bacterium]
MRTLSPPNIKDRFDVYRFFNGLSVEPKVEAGRRRTKAPRVKSFLLEHVARRNNGNQKTPEKIFADMGVGMKRIDDDFMAISGDVTDKESRTTSKQNTGFLEKLDSRFFVYYTSEESEPAQNRVAQWAQSPDLDHTWFSSHLLQELWNRDVSKRGDDRFGKLVFSHDSIFDMPDDFASNVPDDDEETGENSPEDLDDAPPNDDGVDFERRKARFEMKDRVGMIRGSLGKLQQDYDPLYALYALRLPCFAGKGGHDLYQDGRITNCSDSFEALRNTVIYLYRIYKAVLDYSERIAWPETQSSQSLHMGTRGAPLIIRFTESLSEATFSRWTQMAFQKRNRFKLWGDPIQLGPTKVHVYGADRHLWQPINMELTANGMTAILPQGTCGNTIHRLVANVQHYVSPKINTWIGETPYEDIVKEWPAASEKIYEN